jgi:hypothetical protein
VKTKWKSLSLAVFGGIGCLALAAEPARAQGFSFGYSGPGLSVGVATGGPGYYGGGYYGGGYYGGGYYGGGYYGGYPLVRPGPLVAGPVGPVLLGRPVIAPGPWVGPRPYVVGRPYGGYGPYRRRYWR